MDSLMPIEVPFVLSFLAAMLASCPFAKSEVKDHFAVVLALTAVGIGVLQVLEMVLKHFG
jgi:hypothetical protein